MKLSAINSRYSIVLLQTIILFSVFFSPIIAHAQQSWWQTSRAGDGTEVASVAVDHRGASGQTVTTLLNIGFHHRSGCRPEFGMAVLTGGSYGSVVSKTSPPSTKPISLVVDGKSIPTPSPYSVKYANGLEVIFAASDSVIRALAEGSIAVVQLVPGSPRFGFPISGAAAAFETSRKNCMNR